MWRLEWWIIYYITDIRVLSWHSKPAGPACARHKETRVRGPLWSPLPVPQCSQMFVPRDSSGVVTLALFSVERKALEWCRPVPPE